MRERKLVPQDVILDLINDAMIKVFDESNGYVIDGFPRDVEQGKKFEEKIAPCQAVFFLEASDEHMKSRLLERGETSGRDEDSEDYINKRIASFHDASDAVNQYYESKEKLFKFDTEKRRGTVFVDVEEVMDRITLEKSKVLFIIGGPGSGKGTQCEKMAKEFNLTHLSSGDLLRAEVASGSTLGEAVQQIMVKGDLVSLETPLKLLKKEMVKAAVEGTKGFLIDGYPREVRQGIAFDKLVKKADTCVYFNVSDKTMTQRLLKRAETSGRADDNEETIKKRLVTFHQHSEPVIAAYKAKCSVIPAERTVDEIYADVQAALDKM